jgi:hypothetical protein
VVKASQFTREQFAPYKSMDELLYSLNIGYRRVGAAYIIHDPPLYDAIKVYLSLGDSGFTLPEFLEGAMDKNLSSDVLKYRSYNRPK